MKCAYCGNEDPNKLSDDGDTVYCKCCFHRTRIDNGEEDLVLCPVCHHMRDRNAYHCMWCNSAWGTSDESFDQEAYDFVEEFIKDHAKSVISRFIKK